MAVSELDNTTQFHVDASCEKGGGDENEDRLLHIRSDCPVWSLGMSDGSLLVEGSIASPRFRRL